MLYKGFLTVGGLMIGAALPTLIASKQLAWVIFGIGALLIVVGFLEPDRFFKEWIWGPFRPTRREIDSMGSKEYGRHLTNPKFRRYVNWVYRKDAKRQESSVSD